MNADRGEIMGACERQNGHAARAHLPLENCWISFESAFIRVPLRFQSAFLKIIKLFVETCSQEGLFWNSACE
jgi:hypothetical protein